MEKNVIEAAEMSAKTDAIQQSPYGNGKARAIIERMQREKKEFQENAKREYEQNPEIWNMYDRLREKQKLADGRS